MLVKALQLALILVTGFAGAMLARVIGLPIPFLLGSLAASATLSVTWFARSGTRLWYPEILRRAFLATIGTMIGSTFSPEALNLASSLPITLCAMMLFVAAAQGTGYTVFRRLGGYDRPTARYAALPGGMIEAVELGSRAGGDVETLSVQHFVRVILVIVFVPTLFLLFSGEVVGSASGQSLERVPADWADWMTIAIIAALGATIAGWLKLPAAPLIGPLILVAVLQGFDITHIDSPSILLNAAQLVVGTGLGAMFSRTRLRRLLISLGLGVISGTLTLGIAAIFALVLSRWVPMSFEALLISFAPGGLTEMSLIALSLGVSPVVVTTHHMFRILFTVSAAAFFGRRGGNLDSDNSET